MNIGALLKRRTPLPKNMIGIRKSLPCALTIKNTPPLEQGVISPRHGCRLNKEEVELKIKPFIDPDGDDLSYLFMWIRQ